MIEIRSYIINTILRVHSCQFVVNYSFPDLSFEHPDFSALFAEKIAETILLIFLAGSQDTEIFTGAARIIVLH